MSVSESSISGMAGNNEDDMKSLCQTIRILKGHLTRKISSAEKAIEDAGTIPSSHAGQELLEYLKKIQDQYDKIENMYNQLMEMDSENFDRYNDEATAEANRRDAIASKIRRSLWTSGSTPRRLPESAPAEGSGARVKPNRSLEPDKLCRDHNMVEMKSWMRKFKAWYSSSSMELATLQEQQAYFRRVIDVNLENKLSPSIQEDTPIFGSESQVSCMRLLEEEFLLQYPLLTRRVDFFESQQTKGQLFSDWSAQLRALGDEASLTSLTTSDIYVMRYLTGTIDKKLREKFLKEEKPTVELLDKIAHQHEVAASSMRVMDNNRAEAKFVRQGQGYEAQGRRHVPSMKELIEQRCCTRCGNPDHTSNTCSHKNSICFGCQYEGHLKKVCQKYRSGTIKTTRQKATANKVTEQALEDLPEDVDPPENSSDSEGYDEKEVKRILVRQMRDSSTSPRMRVLINDTFFMDACADTGTSRTILSYDMVKKYSLKLYTARERLFAANGERMHCEGRTPLKIDFGRKSTRILALVTSAMKHEMLISLDDMKKMQILPESFPSILVRKVEQNSLSGGQVFLRDLRRLPRHPAEINQGGREVRSEGDGVLPGGGGLRREHVGQVRGRIPAHIRGLQAREGDRLLHRHQKR